MEETVFGIDGIARQECGLGGDRKDVYFAYGYF